MSDWTSLGKMAFGTVIIIGGIAILTLVLSMSQAFGARGTDLLVDEAAAVHQQLIDSYDQMTVRGTAVLSAVDNFSGEQIAIIVRTKNGQVRNYGSSLTTNTGDLTLTVASGLVTNRPIGDIVTRDAQQDAIRTAKDYIGYKANRASHPWINPSAVYRSALIYSQNGVLLGIYCEQDGVTGPII